MHYGGLGMEDDQRLDTLLHEGEHAFLLLDSHGKPKQSYQTASSTRATCAHKPGHPLQAKQLKCATIDTMMGYCY